ncbi:MAG: hypothetical protein WCA35_22045 [Kovacikia sp.]
MNEQISDNPGVIAFPPALYAVTLLIGLVINFIFSVSFLPRPVSLPLASFAMIGAGWLSTSAFRAMNRAKRRSTRQSQQPRSLQTEFFTFATRHECAAGFNSRNYKDYPHDKV